MAVNVVRFAHEGTIHWGTVASGAFVAIEGSYQSTGDLLRAHDVHSLSMVSGRSIAVDEAQILSPITRDQRFICQGANYRKHMLESGMNPDAKQFNMIFTKAASCIVPASSDVIRPSHVRLLDYEIELGVVLKTDIVRRTSVQDLNLHEFIAGIVIVNDYSARDVQIPQTQFFKGKSFRTFGPVGPYLCLLEPGEFRYMKAMQLELRVNGVLRQSGSSEDLIYGPAETLTELSGVLDLAPGDLLSTGTPAGCALAIPSQSDQKALSALPADVKWDSFIEAQEQREEYLKIGDLVEASIFSADGALHLGTQRNRIVAES